MKKLLGLGHGRVRPSSQTQAVCIAYLALLALVQIEIHLNWKHECVCNALCDTDSLYYAVSEVFRYRGIEVDRYSVSLQQEPHQIAICSSSRDAQLQRILKSCRP